MALGRVPTRDGSQRPPHSGVHGSAPEEVIVRGVNDAWDNDAIACIVGAAVGALHGKASFPCPWLDNLLGRTNDSDDRRIFELIAEAQRTFFPPVGKMET